MKKSAFKYILIVFLCAAIITSVLTLTGCANGNLGQIFGNGIYKLSVIDTIAELNTKESEYAERINAIGEIDDTTVTMGGKHRGPNVVISIDEKIVNKSVSTSNTVTWDVYKMYMSEPDEICSETATRLIFDSSHRLSFFTDNMSGSISPYENFYVCSNKIIFCISISIRVYDGSYPYGYSYSSHDITLVFRKEGYAPGGDIPNPSGKTFNDVKTAFQNSEYTISPPKDSFGSNRGFYDLASAAILAFELEGYKAIMVGKNVSDIFNLELYYLVETNNAQEASDLAAEWSSGFPVARNGKLVFISNYPLSSPPGINVFNSVFS